MSEFATGTENTELQGTETKDESSVVLPENQETEKAEGSQGKPEEPGEKRPSGFARRMARHAEELETARLEAEYWKREAMKATAPAEPVTPKGRLDFNSDDEWLEHRLQTERERLIKEARETAAQQAHLEKVALTYQEQLTIAKKELKDWDTVFQTAQEEGMTLPNDAALFVLESPVGARIAYHLAKDVEAYERFIKLPPTRQAAELGKLEERFSKPKAPEETTKKVSEAPAKLAEVKGTGTKQPITAADRFKDKATWREWRQSTKRR